MNYLFMLGLKLSHVGKGGPNDDNGTNGLYLSTGPFHHLTFLRSYAVAHLSHIFSSISTKITLGVGFTQPM